MARIYDHVTDVMRKQIVDVLEARWAVNLLGLTDAERSQLIGWLPHLRPALAELKIDYRDGKKKSISIFSPPRCCRRRSVVAGRSFRHAQALNIATRRDDATFEVVDSADHAGLWINRHSIGTWTGDRGQSSARFCRRDRLRRLIHEHQQVA